MLRNYNENTFRMRGILLEIAMKLISQIEQNDFSILKFLGGCGETQSASSKEKTMAKSILQLEIISQIMMYVEDLIILSESFRKKIPYYKLLDRTESGLDVGQRIKNFFTGLETFTNEDFYSILGYENPNNLDMNDDKRKLVEKIVRLNIMAYRETIIEVDRFSDVHHPVFRRFKHAGAPLVPGARLPSGKSSPLSGFDSCTMAAIGHDPLEDMVPIPLSKDVLTGYKIIITKIQKILIDLLQAHLVCIQRNLNGIIPLKAYGSNNLSNAEEEAYEKIIDEFYRKHPRDPTVPNHLNYPLSKKQLVKIDWYLKLPEFLRENRGQDCKKCNSSGL